VALYAPGSDALIFYRGLAEMLKRQESGRVYCEINPHYAAETCALFEALPGVEVMLRKDITGKDRMIRGIKKSPVGGAF
jgi:release factor glutamine methyltransferase